MIEIFATGADGKERHLALVKQENGTAYVCGLGKYVENDKRASMQCAVGFPVGAIRCADTGEKLEIN